MTPRACRYAMTVCYVMAVTVATRGARQITVPFARLPWIDPEFPQLSQRFAKVMAKRTAI